MPDVSKPESREPPGGGKSSSNNERTISHASGLKSAGGSGNANSPTNGGSAFRAAVAAGGGGGGGALAAGPSRGALTARSPVSAPRGDAALMLSALTSRPGGIRTTGPLGVGNMDGERVTYGAADRAFGDFIHPASMVPGMHANAYDVYRRGDRSWEQQHGFSAGEAGGAVLGGLAPFPLSLITGAAGAAIGEALDPVEPMHIQTDGFVPDYEGLFDGMGGGGALAPGWADQRKETGQAERGTLSPWGRAPEPAAPTPGAPGDAPIDQPMAPPTPGAPGGYNPFLGDPYRYGYGPEHNFFPRSS